MPVLVRGLGRRYITVVGSPEHVADELESWIEQTGLDGFNLTRIVTPESYADFIDLVIPELQRRGSYKTAYDTGSLRQKLFVEGDAHLPDRHPGLQWHQSAACVRHTNSASGCHSRTGQ